MLSSYQISERYNVQSVIWAVVGGVYRAGCAFHQAAGYVWDKRRVIVAALSIPVAIVVAVSLILFSVAFHLASKVGVWVWRRRWEIGYGAWVGLKVLVLTSLCVAGFVVVSMIPMAFWAGAAFSAVVSYVGYNVAGR